MRVCYCILIIFLLTGLVSGMEQYPIEMIPSDFNCILTLDFLEIQKQDLTPLLKEIPGYQAFLDTASVCLKTEEKDIDQIACGFLISSKQPEYLLVMHLKKTPEMDMSRAKKFQYGKKHYYLYSSWRDLDDCFWTQGKWIVFGTEKAMKMFLLQKNPGIPPHFAKNKILAGFRMLRNHWSDKLFLENPVSDVFENLQSLTLTLENRNSLLLQTSLQFEKDEEIISAKKVIQEYFNFLSSQENTHSSIKKLLEQSVIASYKKTLLIKNELPSNILQEIKQSFNP